jgi:hypothetical protein
VVLQKSQEQDDRLPPPLTLIVDFTLTHTHYGRSRVHSIGQLTNTRSSDGAPEPDGDLRCSGRWIGKRFFIIANCTLIAQNRLHLCQSQLTRQVSHLR